ncbi:hypothetical protein KP509_20G007100 [Ceratopteris richardii]|nr:hypothetical protein KP509_20G007100 [Ceratopteris richardii]
MYDAGSRIVRCPPGEQREQAKKDLIEALQTLDGALRDMSKGGAYFGGSDLGYVDVALAPFLCWFEAYETMGEFKIWESCDCPHLSKWAKDVLEHPSVKGAVTIAPSAKVVDFAHILRQRYGGA